ncbi:hypothetical protein ACG1BZ_05680 [Microbulbifer sp. CNSA002]|uniref:hypothetical protein n=1 Tax=Microbulbifer sp. CNSA002 TaxID=3373604 RepID=UPI0039B3F687
MITKKYTLIAMSVVLTACAGVTEPIKFKASSVLTEDYYHDTKVTNGVVLLDVNWGRWWDCGGYENAQLVSMAFDKLPMSSINNEAEPALVLHSPSRLAVDPVFTNYAYSLEPGEYAISAFSIKAAKSVSNVGFLTAQRDKLYSAGKPVGGTFTVKPGEAVFIGNFYLDCAYGPTLWRYHSDGREAFDDQVKEYASRFPYLDLTNVQFRLFKTKEFGNDYELVP